MQASPSDGMHTSSSGVTCTPPLDEIESFSSVDETDEARFLNEGSDTGEHIRARLPCANANHFF